MDCFDRIAQARSWFAGSTTLATAVVLLFKAWRRS
jgi:hypothetical protein